MFSAPGHVTGLSFFYERVSEGLFLLFSLKDLSQIWPGKAEEAPLISYSVVVKLSTELFLIISHYFVLYSLHDFKNKSNCYNNYYNI